MKVLIITMEKTKSSVAANQHVLDSTNSPGNHGYGTNDLACRRRKRVLPIQLLAIAGDIMDAGHKVHWPDESLNQENKDRLIAEAQLFNPDVVFFAGGDQHTQQLMANVAVKTNSVPGNEFLSAKMFCSAGYWRDSLTEEGVSVNQLLKKLTDGSHS